MRNELKRFRILIFSLSILIFFCLIHSQYDSLGKTRFLSPIAFENLEDEGGGNEEDLAIDPPVQLEEVVLAAFVDFSHLRIHFFKDFSSSPFQAFTFERKISILRC